MNTSLKMATLRDRKMYEATLFIIHKIYVSVYELVGRLFHNDLSMPGHFNCLQKEFFSSSSSFSISKLISFRQSIGLLGRERVIFLTRLSTNHLSS